jgi:hypothetical protein
MKVKSMIICLRIGKCHVLPLYATEKIKPKNGDMMLTKPIKAEIKTAPAYSITNGTSAI